MSERKAINKYYPPDYDPSKVPKTKNKSKAAIKVRLLAPFSMRCLKCDEYISSSRKFNATKEDTKEKYLDIKIFRFHIRCPICNNAICFRTHPQSSGFVLDSGAKRNFEPKTQNIPVHETEDEILERLLKEDQENKKYQELKENRKKNPFWKQNTDLKNGDGNLSENLGDKLLEQQKQHEMMEHLEYLQKKNAKLQQREKGLHDAELGDISFDNKLSSEDKLIKDAFKNFKSNAGDEPIDSLKRLLTQKKPLVIKKPKLNLTKKDTKPTLVDYSSSDDD